MVSRLWVLLLLLLSFQGRTNASNRGGETSLVGRLLRATQSRLLQVDSDRKGKKDKKDKNSKDKKNKKEDKDTEMPTDTPTNKPTDRPTPTPTDRRTDIPTNMPTDSSSDMPSNAPTDEPTPSPPSSAPSFIPSSAPSFIPSPTPSFIPSFTPSFSPSFSPTLTFAPTRTKVLEISCLDQDPTRLTFDTVLLEVTGRLAQVAQNPSDLVILGSAFVDTYNSLIEPVSDECGGSFRSMIRANFTIPSSLSPESVLARLTRPFILQLSTTILCRGCSEALFRGSATDITAQHALQGFASAPKGSKGVVDNRQLKKSKSKKTPVPTPSPTPQPTPVPTLQPSPNPTPQPTPAPTLQPTPEPTLQPTREPTSQPTREPTSSQPTREPTSSQPTREPITSQPSPEPTPQPTPQPTTQPSVAPSPSPSSSPTQIVFEACPAMTVCEEPPIEADFLVGLDQALRLFSEMGELVGIDGLPQPEVTIPDPINNVTDPINNVTDPINNVTDPVTNATVPPEPVVVELEEIDCDLDAFQDFSTNVFVDFEVDERVTEISDTDGMILAQAVLEIYNTLNTLPIQTGNCDESFRTINQVQLVSQDAEFNRRERRRRRLEHEEKHRLLQLLPTVNVTNVTNSANFTDVQVDIRPRFLLRFDFRVSGRCTQCSNELELFGDASGRRRLGHVMEIDAEVLFQPRELQDPETDGCFCPVEPVESRPPTREEFTEAYNATIGALVEEQLIETELEVVAEVNEVVEVACPVNDDNFTTTLSLRLSGNPMTLSDDERLVLEKFFVIIYNQEVEDFCDPLFRTVLSAQIINVTEDMNQPVDANPRIFLVEFEAEGRCRGCDPNTNLFDSSVGNRRLAVAARDTSVRARYLQNNQCFCDTLALNDMRTPTEAEFQVRYSAEIERLGLFSIEEVQSLEEPDPSAAPSVSPAPSLFPTTSAPSVFNQVLFQTIAAYPLSVDEAISGPDGPSAPAGEIPIYTFGSLPETGVVTGARSFDGSEVTVEILETIVPWDAISPVFDQAIAGNMELAAAAVERQVEARLINATITGLSGVVVPFISLAISYVEDGSNVVELLSFTEVDDENYFASSSGRRQRNLMWDPELPTRDSFHRSLQQQCDNFVNDALNTCPADNSFVLATNHPCIAGLETEYQTGLQNIELSRQQLVETVATERTTLLVERCSTQTASRVLCFLSMAVTGVCLAGGATDVIGQAVNDIDALDVTQQTETSNVDNSLADLCARVAIEIVTRECFACNPCSTSNVECCTDDDCAVQDVCGANTCISSGPLQFTLEWIGNDNLALVVTNPDGDSTQATSTTPNGVYGTYIQNVVFPGFTPVGIYSYEVVGGTGLESWVLTVRVSGFMVATQSGTTLQSFSYDFLGITSPPPTSSFAPSSTLTPTAISEGQRRRRSLEQTTNSGTNRRALEEEEAMHTFENDEFAVALKHLLI